MMIFTCAVPSSQGTTRKQCVRRTAVAPSPRNASRREIRFVREVVVTLSGGGTGNEASYRPSLRDWLGAVFYASVFGARKECTLVFAQSFASDPLLASNPLKL
jgi:hypothetical protein